MNKIGDKNQIHLGIAPIAWTNDDLPELGAENSFEQCISEMALAGYSGCEIGNKYPRNPKILKEYLNIRGLSVCNQWFSSFILLKSFADVEKEFLTQITFLKAMGANIIGPCEQTRSCLTRQKPIFTGKPLFDSSEFKLLVRVMNRLGKIASDEGLKLAYHHHMGTGIQTLEETEQFLDATEPEHVFLLYDSGHFAFSGDDPVKSLKKVISRVGHVHLKDIRPQVLEFVKEGNLSFLEAVKKGVFTVPGDGCIDFPALFKLLAEHNYGGWMVVEAEQDPAKANPFVYAKKARDYIYSLTGI